MGLEAIGTGTRLKCNILNELKKRAWLSVSGYLELKLIKQKGRLAWLPANDFLHLDMFPYILGYWQDTFLCPAQPCQVSLPYEVNRGKQSNTCSLITSYVSWLPLEYFFFFLKPICGILL